MIRIYTAEQAERANEALAQTAALIVTEMSYAPKHQKQEYLAFLNSHKANLIEATNTWEAR